MKEEFAVYGLPAWSVGVVGFLKILLAALLIAGIWLPAVTKPAAIGMAVLMLGAVSMHIKVKDPLQRSLVLVAVL
ncbi:MAG: DoxX family protein [Planctomycetota bacterium]